MIIFVSFERNNQHIFSFFFRHNDDNYQTLEVTTWNYTKVQVCFQYIKVQFLKNQNFILIQLQ